MIDLFERLISNQLTLLVNSDGFFIHYFHHLDGDSSSLFLLNISDKQIVQQ